MSKDEGKAGRRTVASASRIWTAANLLTASRLLLLPLIMILIIREQRLAAFIVMLVSLGTDVFDGYIARRFGQETEFGKVLDPVVDKICLAGILIALLAVQSIPLWVVLIIVARDLFILGGSMVIWKRRKFVYKANSLGRLAGLLFGTMVCAFIINWRIVGMVAFFLSLPMMMAAFIIYLKRYVTSTDSRSEGDADDRGCEENEVDEKPG